MSAERNQRVAHEIVIDRDREHSGHMLHAGHRARCSCGWSSDLYAQRSYTERAIEVHLRKARTGDFDALIAKSSIGAALKDIKTRGIEAHLVDLEREMHPKKRGRPPRAGEISKPITVRVSADERLAWEGAAGDQQLSDWIRARCDTRAARLTRKDVDAAFLRGFGLALVILWRTHRDAQLVRHLFKESGLKLKDFKGAGLRRRDLVTLRRAVQK